MSVAPVREAVRIDVASGCTDDHCLKMGWGLKEQLDPDYARGAAVMPLTGTFVEFMYQHRTARRRAAYAERAHYTMSLVDRAEHVDDVYAINTSLPVRQGRPMGAGYMERPEYGPNPKFCAFHHVYTYGVLLDDRLVAYLWLYRSGELALVSSILGHAEHLQRNVMYLLYVEMLRHQWPLGGTVFYNMWNSGTDGLRFFKERVGLVEGDVEWALV